MFTDLPLETLRQYTGAVKEPPDMVQFWEGTVGQARQFGINTRLQRLETSLQAIEVWDVTFLGWGGEPIKAWLRLPTGSNQPLPGVVQYQGYNGGRDHPLADLAWAAAGFAHLVMDN
ncbi:MAG: acetylxylan esterase, partial [Propionibacteriaceae bacterium]|nr:acetylxylan esterase [Propionibacteriaceae bacterium]